MIRRQVLAALAEGVAAGHDDAARDAVLRTEWLLRGRAKRRLEQALIDAALATNEPNSFHDPDAARHVHRVAALMVSRVDVDPTDRAAVAAEYAGLPVVTPRRAPVATLLLATSLAVVAAIAVILATTGTEDPRRRTRTVESYVRPLPPPVAGAYEKGGAPLRDEALEKLFADAFTDYVLEVDRDRARGGMDPVRAQHAIELRDAKAVAARGPGLANAWHDLIEMLEHWVHVPADGPGFKAFSRELRAKVRVVSDQLAAAGVGLYLEGLVRSRSDRAHAIVYTYRVEEVVFTRVGQERRRVLSLRRLDLLNRSWAVLGMQSEELGDPVLLLDKIDEHVASTVFPVLARDTAYPLGEFPGGEQVADSAGAAVRSELLQALGPDAARAGQIATLLAERTKLVEKWRGLVAELGLRLPRLEGLYLPETLLASLEKRVSKSEVERARDIDERLAQLEAGRIASRLHTLIAATVRRHEAWHGVDADRDEPLRYPAMLEEYLGPEVDDDGDIRRPVEHARAELSAYLCQIANDPATPHYALWHVARSTFERKLWGGAESYAGVMILEGLGRQLGIKTELPIIYDRAIDRGRLIRAAHALAAASGDQLRAAARSLWVELYGEQLVTIVD